MKKGALLVLLIICLVLVSCSSDKTKEPLPVQSYNPSDFQSEKTLRPSIDKVEVEEQDKLPEIEHKDESRGVIEVPSLATPVEAYRFQVGYGLASINNSLATLAPFTKYNFPELLKSRNVVSGYEPVAGRYEQFLRLAGGKILYTGDEFEQVSDFLVYRDGEPIFVYELFLEDGSFLDYIERDIWLLGNLYTIVDVTKQDIILVNVETKDRIVFGGGTVLWNDEKLENTDSRMLGNRLLLTAKADAVMQSDDIFIAPGMSLLDYMGEPTLLTDKINIRYVGVLDLPHTIYTFNNKKDEIELRIGDLYRGRLRIPLGILEGDGFRLGDEEGLLHIKEADSKVHYKIKKEDYFILTVPQIYMTQIYERYKTNQTGAVSIVFQYKGWNPRQQKIEVASEEGIAMEATYKGYTDDASATGIIPFAGHNFRFFVGPDGSLSVDLNGDGWISGAIVDFIFRDGIIDMPSKEHFDGPANITLKLLNYEVRGMREETSSIQINPDGEFTLTLHTPLETWDLGKDDKIAISGFGTEYFLMNQEGKDEYEEIVVNHPLSERLAEIIVESR